MASVRDILRDLGLSYREAGEHHHVSHGWIGIDCPQCSPNSGRFRCGINLRSISASCWICGKLKLPHVLSRAADRPISDIIRLLSQIDRVAFIGQRDSSGLAGIYKEPAGLVPLAEPHRRYLEGRRLDPDQMVSLWGLKGIGNAVHYSWSIFLPIVVQSRPVSWTTRAIGSRVETRYLSAPPDHEFTPLKQTVFGQDHIRNSVVIVEGPFDVMAIGPGAVSLYGLQWSWRQLAILTRATTRFICFDSSPDAQRKASQLSHELAVFGGETRICTIKAKDAGEALEQERQELRSLLF